MSRPAPERARNRADQTPPPRRNRAPRAAAAVAAAAATTSAEAAPAPSAAAGRALARFVHRQRATIQILAVQGFDGGMSRLIALDVNEAEAARLTGHPVGHDLDTDGLDARALERSAHAVLGGMECQVPHVQSLAHLTDSSVHDPAQRSREMAPDRAAGRAHGSRSERRPLRPPRPKDPRKAPPNRKPANQRTDSDEDRRSSLRGSRETRIRRGSATREAWSVARG